MKLERVLIDSSHQLDPGLRAGLVQLFVRPETRPPIMWSLREQEIKSSVCVENYWKTDFWDRLSQFIFAEILKMLTLWHSLCAESRDVRKHMQLYHRGQTLVEAIIPQGKHEMFVLKGGENIPPLRSHGGAFPGIFSPHPHCFALRWQCLIGLTRAKGSFILFRKTFISGFSAGTDAAC